MYLGTEQIQISNAKVDSASVPELMTEEELVQFLRIPLISNAQDHHHVIENLKRIHNLPCIHICNKSLYPLNAIRRWIEEKLLKEQR